MRSTFSNVSTDSALVQLAKPIEQGHWPRPSCPACGSGYIAFEEPVTYPSQESRSLQDHPAFDPEWVSGTFTVLGRCENQQCQQTTHGAGDYSVAYASEHVYEDGPSYSDYYVVGTVYPASMLMSIPAAAPDAVRKGIQRASRVLFTDPGLAATALRSTVELFLTSQGISATKASGNGYRPADERIREWSAADSTRPQIADLLFAVKWLGNAGTHEDSDLSAVEVLDGARVLDEAFHRLFTGPDIQNHAQAINSAKGPVR